MPKSNETVANGAPSQSAPVVPAAVAERVNAAAPPVESAAVPVIDERMARVLAFRQKFGKSFTVTATMPDGSKERHVFRKFPADGRDETLVSLAKTDTDKAGAGGKYGGRQQLKGKGAYQSLESEDNAEHVLIMLEIGVS